MHGGTPCLLLVATKISKNAESAKKKGNKTRPPPNRVSRVVLFVRLQSDARGLSSANRRPLVQVVCQLSQNIVTTVTEYRDNCHGISRQLSQNIVPTVTQHEMPIFQWLLAYHWQAGCPFSNGCLPISRRLPAHHWAKPTNPAVFNFITKTKKTLCASVRGGEALCCLRSGGL